MVRDRLHEPLYSCAASYTGTLQELISQTGIAIALTMAASRSLRNSISNAGPAEDKQKYLKAVT
ncbi:MAG: hypothetical protein ED559_05280 [Phycisphaera sp.]|nr:MAG: hypothetical protein ED559_05280 [Phycisphaera sp.]